MGVDTLLILVRSNLVHVYIKNTYENYKKDWCGAIPHFNKDWCTKTLPCRTNVYAHV